MEECIHFINEIFDLESSTVLKSFRPNLEEYNSSLKKLQSTVLPELGYPFLMQPLEQLRDPDFYEEYAAFTSLPNRRLYRLNHHLVNGTDYYLAFVDEYGLQYPTGFSVLWVITRIDGKFKIVAHYRHPLESKKEAWRFIGGDQRYDLASFGTPKEVFRMKDPKIEDETALLFEHVTGLQF